jgi:hypothetical protein
MANIPGFDTPNLGLQPTETGINARVQSAYRGRALFDQAANATAQAGAKLGAGIAAAGQAAVQYESHREISAGAAHGAQMLANLTDDWNKTAQEAAQKDPNDPSVAPRWREQTLEQKLEEFKSGFNTEQSQQWAEHFTEQVRNHMFEKTTADMSGLAKIAADSNARTVANTLSNTAINDPSAVPFLLQSVDHQIGGIIDSSPNIRGVDAARAKIEIGEKTKEAIVKAGFYGAIQNAQDPEAIAAIWTKKYPQYINGAEAVTFAHAATSQRKVNEYYTRAAINEQKREATLGADRAINDAWDKHVTVDPDGTTHIAPDFFKTIAKIPGQFQNAPGAAEKAKTYIDWAQSQLKQQETGKYNKDDPQAFSQLNGMMFDPDKPTSIVDVRKAEADGHLSTKSGTVLVELIRARDADPIKDPAFKAAIDAARSQIELNAGGIKIGADKYAAFMQNFMSDYQRQKRAGTLPPNALDLADPNSLISQHMKGRTLGVGEAVTANGGVGAAPAAPAPAKPAAPVKITNKAEYDRLAPGTGFIGPDGKPYVKPMKAAQ